jgi:uncharacterized membrane protein
MSTQQHVIVATFGGTDQAEHALPALESLSRHLHTLALGNVAILEKTPDGTVHVHETHDPRTGISRIIANAAGSVTWLVYGLFGLPGPVAGELAADGTSAAIRRVVRDMGFDDAELEVLGDELDAGSSALILVVPADATPAVSEELGRLGGTVISRPFTPDLAEELEGEPS